MASIYTQKTPLTKILGHDSTASSYPTLVPLLTLANQPKSVDLASPTTGNYGVQRLSDNWLLIVPFGTGSAGTLNMNVRFVHKCGVPDSWYVTDQYTFGVTLGTVTGTANTPVDASHYLAASATSTSGSSRYVIEGNNPVRILVDPCGAEFAIISFTLGTASAANALVSTL
jgi:hypothetical protein